ncbi:MAG: hypothetical protein ACR2PL_19430 [Dehalococcoidia bacterium]
MVKLDQIRDEELRHELQAARQAMRSGDHTEAVRRCVSAYERFLGAHPELIKQQAGPMNRLAPLMWPRLGANLSVSEGVPSFDWHRDRFGLAEAATYYEFTVDSLVANGG